MHAEAAQGPTARWRAQGARPLRGRLVAHLNAALWARWGGGGPRHVHSTVNRSAGPLLREPATQRLCASQTPGQRTARGAAFIARPCSAPERPSVFPDVHDALNSLAQWHRRRQCPFARRIRNESLQALKLSIGQDAPRPGRRVLLAERGPEPQGSLLLPQSRPVVDEGPALRLPAPRTRASGCEPACGSGERQPRRRAGAGSGERNAPCSSQHRRWGASQTRSRSPPAQAGAPNGGGGALRAGGWPRGDRGSFLLGGRALAGGRASGRAARRLARAVVSGVATAGAARPLRPPAPCPLLALERARSRGARDHGDRGP